MKRFVALVHTHRNRLHFLIRYGVTGVVGGVIQTLLLYIWITLLGFERTYLFGLILGFIIALCVTFLLQKYWTFRDQETKRIPRQLFLYGTVALSGLVLNTVLLVDAKSLFGWFGINFFHIWYLIVQAGIFCIVSAFNLCMNYIFTFRHVRQKHLHGT